MKNSDTQNSSEKNAFTGGSGEQSTGKMNELNNEQFKQDSLKDSQQSSYENDIDGLEVKNEDVHVKLNNSGVRKSFNKEFIERIMNYVTS